MDVARYLVPEGVNDLLNRRIIAAVDTRLPMIFYGAPVPANKLPDEYVYVVVQEEGAEKYTMSPCGFKRDVTVLIEIVTLLKNRQIGNRIKYDVEQLFLQQFDQYSIFVHGIKALPITTTRDVRYNINIALDYIY